MLNSKIYLELVAEIFVGPLNIHRGIQPRETNNNKILCWLSLISNWFIEISYLLYVHLNKLILDLICNDSVCCINIPVAFNNLFGILNKIYYFNGLTCFYKSF